MAAVEDGKLVIMYLDGEPTIGPNKATNSIFFYGQCDDKIVEISGYDSTWEPLYQKSLDRLPLAPGKEEELYTFVELGDEDHYMWASSQEFRNGLQLYTRSEIQTLTQNKWVAQSEDGITYNVVFTADNNKDPIIDSDLITTGCSFVIIPSMTSTSTNTILAIYDIPYSLRLRGTGDTNTAVVPSKADWLVANKPIRVTYDGTYWVADLMDDIPTGMTYEEEKLPTKPTTPIADGQEIPYTWEEINAITLAGKAQEYFSLGSIKMLNLSTAVLGANKATMMVIGFDQDGENTVTFQTKGTLPTTTVFGSSSAEWISSTVRTQCQNFYNACEAKAFIKTVSKGTAAYNSSRNGAVTYTDETVWIPSEREMGLDTYSSLSTANSTTSKAECTKGYNAAYSYYTSNTTRVKYRMNANGTLTTSTAIYWERSRFHSNSSYVCYVYNNGIAVDGVYSVSLGFAPAFVIGNGTFSAKITQDGEDITNKLSALFGGVKIATGSYVGTGTTGSTGQSSLTFDFSPKLVFLTSTSWTTPSQDYLIFPAKGYGNRLWLNRSEGFLVYNKIIYNWNGTTLSWYVDTKQRANSYGASTLTEISPISTDQFNSQFCTYYWYAIG